MDKEAMVNTVVQNPTQKETGIFLNEPPVTEESSKEFQGLISEDENRLAMHLLEGTEYRETNLL